MFCQWHCQFAAFPSGSMRKALFHSIESLDSKLKGVLHYDALLNDPVSFALLIFLFP